jgi:SNF2 family DNA or RNA helicase
VIEPPKIFTPRVYQELIRNFVLDNERGNVFASPGTGKTSSTFDAYDTLRMFGEVKRMLVLGPKRVAKNVWPAERDKWGLSFGHLKVAAAIGTPEQRKAAVMSKPDILTINYDNIEWLIDGYGDDWPFDMVAADESTFIKGLRIHLTKLNNIKGQGSVRAKSLARVAHTKVHRWLNLTGSPAPNGLQDQWGQQWFVDAGKRLGGDFKSFTDRWFYARATPDGYTQLTPHAHAQREIENRMKDCCITIDARDYFDIDKVIERHVYIDLPPAARRAYQTMEKELFANINAHSIEVYSAGGKSNKCLQIANGSVYHDNEGSWTKAHDEKIEALKSIVAEWNGEPILVRYLFKSDLARIKEAFPRMRVLDDKKQTEDDWNAGFIPLLAAHAKGAGHGLSLQDGGFVLVDYGSDFNLEYDEQIIERIGPTRQVQSGHKRPVYRYRIIARDTIEEDSVLPRLKYKMSVQDSFKLAMKRRG